jgi:uncharacterized protein (TIGR02646 family)
MLEIKKVETPDFFNSWIENKKEYSQRLREFILEKEQSNVCCYCEKGITADKNKSHIEHIRPQAKFPQLKNNYNNLVVSCETVGRCGKAKGNKFSKHFIVSTEENPGEYLTYSPYGEIKAINNNNKGIETISILNLNAPSLVKARRTLFIQLKALSDSIDDFEKYFNEYPTFMEYFKENYKNTPQKYL